MDKVTNNDVPSKERKERESRVQGRVGIRAGGGVHLPASAQAIKGVEQARTHEANKTQKCDLGDGAVIHPLQSSWPFESGGLLFLGVRGVCPRARDIRAMLVALLVVGHDE